jgi:hypothetical protein
VQIKSFKIEAIWITQEELIEFLLNNSSVRYELSYNDDAIDKIIKKEFTDKNRREMPLAEFIESWFWQKY